MPQVGTEKAVREGRFDLPIESLHPELRAWIEKNLLVAPVWNSLSLEQRREAFRQWDIQHNPSIRRENARAWKLANEIIELEGTATPTAGDWMAKKAGIADLQRASDDNDAEAERILANARSKAASDAWNHRLFEDEFWPLKRAIAVDLIRDPAINEENLRAAKWYDAKHDANPAPAKPVVDNPGRDLVRACQTGRLVGFRDGTALRPEQWLTSGDRKQPTNVLFYRADVLRLWHQEPDPAHAKIEEQTIAAALAWTRPASNAGTANAAPDPYTTLDEAIRSLMPVEYQDGSFQKAWEGKSEAERAALKVQLLQDIDKAMGRMISPHVERRCNLIGRRTAFNSNEPLRDHERIPNELFARETFANGNFLHPREQLHVYGAHPEYWADVKMLRSEFEQAFKPVKTEQDLWKWLAEFLGREGEAPTEKQATTEFVKGRGWTTTVFRPLWAKRPNEFRRGSGKRLKPICGTMHKMSGGGPQSTAVSGTDK